MIKIDNKIHLYWNDIELLTDKLCEEITKIPNVTHISGLSRGGLIRPTSLTFFLESLKASSSSKLFLEKMTISEDNVASFNLSSWKTLTDSSSCNWLINCKTKIL